MNPTTAPYGALLLRVALGVVLIAHGLLKVLVFTLPGTAEFFASVGFPGWMAYPVTLAELAGGAALIVGFQVRLVAAVMAVELLGATSVHLHNGWTFDSKDGGWEYPAFLVVAAVVVSLLGAGAHALDGRNQTG
ncbi:MAG: DoxX family protein [Burkholderiales bacterium]